MEFIFKIKQTRAKQKHTHTSISPDKSITFIVEKKKRNLKSAQFIVEIKIYHTDQLN